MAYIDKIHARLDQLRKQYVQWKGDPAYLETLAIDIAGLECLLKQTSLAAEAMYEVGQSVNKRRGYKFPGRIAAVFKTLELGSSAQLRYIVQMDEYRLLHIFNEDQLEAGEPNTDGRYSDFRGSDA